METRKPRTSPILQTLLGNFIFLLFCSTLLSFAQAQQPMELIDFEDFSPAAWPYRASPTLQILSASFSGGVLVLDGAWGDEDDSTVYATTSACDGCSPTITINFSQKVSNFSVLLLNGNYQAVTFTISDDQGGQQQITLAPYGLGFGDVRTASLPDNNISRVTIAGYGCYAIDNVQFRPSGPVLLDPVDSGFLSGPQVTTDPNVLSQGGVIVQGAAADGVTETVVRIPANYPGESLSVNTLDENGQPVDDKTDYGGLFALGGSPQSAASTLTVTAGSTSMAFAIYLSPVNFARNPQQYPNDQNIVSRAFSLQIHSNDVPNYNLTLNASIVRPPVVLVHGIWSSAADWGKASSFLPLNGLWVVPVDYYWPLLQVTATYPPSNVTTIPGSALGFNYNAPIVDNDIRESIHGFRIIYNVAAVTADVVAHSMGGDIVRTEALLPGFASNDTYGHGPIDKLITIGTPHLGSPLATKLLQSANSCVQQALTTNGSPSFMTVTTSLGGLTNGGVGDLEGDGSPFGFLSTALLNLANAPHPPFRMALISALEGANNLAGLDCFWPTDNCRSSQLYLACGIKSGTGDPLALALAWTQEGSVWEQMVFGAAPGEYVSDAVVPLMSQLNGGLQGGPNTPTLTGVMHSPGMTSLNFVPPTELDQNSGVPGQVVNLLNEPPTGPDFQ